MDDVVKQANGLLVHEQRITSKTYWAFVRGQQRITASQISAIAKVLGVTVHIMTHYSPGHVPVDEGAVRSKKLPTITVDEPTRRTERKKKAQGRAKSKPASTPRPYNADEAAKLLAKKFGDRVKRDRSSR